MKNKYKIITLFTFALLTFSNSFSQNPKLLNPDSVIFLRAFGSNTFSIVTNADRKARYKYNYYLNTIKVDSTNRGIYSNLYNKPSGDYFFEEDKNDTLHYFKINERGKIEEILKTKTRYFGVMEDELIGVDQNSYEEIDEEPAFGNVSGGMKHQNELIRKVVAFNVNSRYKRELFNIEKLDISQNEDIIKLFFLPEGKKILFTTGTYESGGQPIDNIFIYDILTNNITEKVFSSNLTDENRGNRKWNPRFFQFYDITSNYLFISDCILDADFNFVSKSVSKATGTSVFFLDVSKNFFWISSELDTLKKFSRLEFSKVLVQYPMTVDLEINLFKIYNNSPLDKKEIAKLSVGELNIMKNMIFAKHNYQFSSKYYQAVFNLFTFYRNARNKGRTKNVNHLLTETDKANLLLITQQIKKKG